MASIKPNKELFKAHLRYWKDKLGLSNYFIEVDYSLGRVGAECELDHASLCPTITIGDVDEVWTEAILARHEMLELLLEPLKALLWENVHSDKSYRAGHEVIHRLESILPIPSDKEVGYVGKKKKKKVKKGVEPVPCGKKKKPKGK